MQSRTEQVHLENMATLDLAIALYAQQDIDLETGLGLLEALVPLLAVPARRHSLQHSNDRLDHRVSLAMTSYMHVYLEPQRSSQLADINGDQYPANCQVLECVASEASM